MELPPFDNTSKIWAPSLDDLRKFCDTNKYVRQQLHGDKLKNDGDQNKENGGIIKTEQSENPVQVLINGDLPISCFLYYVVKKSEVSYFNDITKPKIHFMEEEASVLCGMMKREGFLGEETPDATDEQDCCITCATEKLEKDLMETAQREMIIISLARKYYTLPENENKYNICANHRPFQTKNCVPKGNGINNSVQISQPGPSREILREQNKNTMSSQHYFNPELPEKYATQPKKYISTEQTYFNAQNGRIRAPMTLPRSYYDTDLFLNHQENSWPQSYYLGAQPEPQLSQVAQVSQLSQVSQASQVSQISQVTQTAQPTQIAPQFVPNTASKIPEQSLNYMSNIINPQIPPEYLFEPETCNYYQTSELNDFTALFQKCILGQSQQNLASNNLANQPTTSTYLPNNYTLNGQNRFIDQNAQSVNNLHNNRIPSNYPNYAVNRAVNHNSTNFFENSRQNEISAAVSSITRELQQQILLNGNRVGRKILGKRY